MLHNSLLKIHNLHKYYNKIQSLTQNKCILWIRRTCRPERRLWLMCSLRLKLLKSIWLRSPNKCQRLLWYRSMLRNNPLRTHNLRKYCSKIRRPIRNKCTQLILRKSRQAKRRVWTYSLRLKLLKLKKSSRLRTKNMSRTFLSCHNTLHSNPCCFHNLHILSNSSQMWIQHT